MARIHAPTRLADVEIVMKDEEGGGPTSVSGATVAALLDVVDDADRLLDPEAIALELDHVADLLEALAHRSESPTAGALSIAERCVRRLAARVDGLRPGARTHARRFVIAPGVREHAREYGAGSRVLSLARWTSALPAS
jgi:hypothetical protein